MAPHIGFIGPMGVGKSTAAKHLAEQYRYTVVSFADPLREIALALDPIVGVCSEACCEPQGGLTRLSEVVDQYGWSRAKEAYPEVRRTLQRLGTEAGRNVYGEDHWVELAWQRFDELWAATSMPYRAAFDDCRFDNEAASIRKYGGVIVRLDRPGLKHTKERDHFSEHGITTPADYRITTSTEEELTWALDGLMDHLGVIPHE